MINMTYVMIKICIVGYVKLEEGLWSGRHPELTQIWAKMRQTEIIIKIKRQNGRHSTMIKGKQMRTWHIWGTTSCLGFKMPGIGNGMRWGWWMF